MTGAGHWGTRSTTVVERRVRDATWQAQIVTHLRVSKTEGFAFATAWSMAVHAVQIPTRDDFQPQLFSAGGGSGETVASFFRRACEKAYTNYVGAAGSGDGPALRHFSYDMADDEVRLSPVMAA